MIKIKRKRKKTSKLLKKLDSHISDNKNTVGVYLLIHKKEVVYVGKSVDVKFRLKTHINQRLKVFSNFEIIECDHYSLDELELKAITKYNPIFNEQLSITKPISLLDYCIKYNIKYEESSKIPLPVRKERKTKMLGHRVTPTRHTEVTKFVDFRDWDISKFLDRAVNESIVKALFEESGCEGCGNYIDDKFENANCSGCSKNPFYINCFTSKGN